MAEKLVIFDCDGVLVDTEYVASKVFVEALAEYGYQISLEECIRRFTGVHEHVCREMIMEESGLAIPEDYWAKAQVDLVKAYETDLISLMQPVLTMLQSQNIPRCVASNSSRKHVLHCLEFTNQLHYFTEDSIFNSKQVAKPKPAPDLFLFSANQMGANPENCIVIEDSVIGAEAAIAAGMEVFLFLGGRHAGFESYQSKVAAYKKPMFSTHEALQDAIEESLSLKYDPCAIKLQ
jgi:HAD superfamily hydrolase (TIGR01509 family)